MNEALIEYIADKVIKRLTSPSVEIEASGRHVHLSREAVDILFGKGYTLTKKSNLSQPGQFACEERLTVQGPKKTISNVIVLGPERPDTQVELSATDALALGIKAPVRMSGDIKGTPGIRLIGPAGQLDIPQGVIIAMRHIHMTPEDALGFGVKDGEAVDVQASGGRPVTFHDVIIRVSPSFATYMHIDYDEANACGLEKGMRGVVSTQHSGR